MSKMDILMTCVQLTDRSTDQQRDKETAAKQYASFEGGHNK